MTVDRIEDFQALEPFFRVIEDGLAGLVDGGHFFDLLADDVVFEFIITVPDYPRRIAGRDNLIDLYRGYHNAFFLDRCFDLRTYRADDSTVTLEYASEGRAVATGRPYSNHYISASIHRLNMSDHFLGRRPQGVILEVRGGAWLACRSLCCGLSECLCRGSWLAVCRVAVEAVGAR